MAKLFNRYNLLWHILLTIILVLLAFSKIIPNINQVYFSKHGDGFRTYYGMYYHAKYDTTYHRIEAMNYPWGEIINFTDCQPPVSNSIKFISQNIYDITDYTTGINNGLMIFSLLLASIFIYLILRKLKIATWYSSILALCIVFLSPQIQRMGGHFSLSWMFWIPLSIYLLLHFDEKKSWSLSMLIALCAYIAGSMHYYFLAFWLFLFFPYWFYRWFILKDKPFQKSDLLHLLIQVIVPLLILQLNLLLNDSISDRTSSPWGFYSFHGRFAGVFLPLFKSYFPFFNEMSFAKKVPWEAFSYIGLVSSTGFFILSYQWLSKSIKQKKIQSYTGHKMLDYLMGISFLILLFSFGIPFVLGLDKLRQFAGPLGQLRGLARFGWLFYYTINIVIFRHIFIYFFKTGKSIKVKAVTLLLLGIFVFEAFSYSGKYQNTLNNHIPDNHINKEGSLASFVKDQVNANLYQAVLPLPYFNIGSESIWLEPKCQSMQNSFIASMHTGLPNIGVMAARTSLSQTYKNIALTLTPWKEYEVLNDYTSEKPLLLMVASCEDQLNENEKRLIKHSSLVGNKDETTFYSLEIDSLRALPGKYNFPERYHTMTDSIQKLAKDTLASLSYPDNANKTLQVDAPAKHQQIFEDLVKINPQQPVFVRFWVKNYNHDLVARTQLLLIQSKPDHQTIEEKYTDIFRNIRTINGDWALVEIELQPQQKYQIFKTLIRNKDINGETLYFKEFTVSQLPFGKD
ncbi:MAG: hypothetical protein JXR50_05765 [Prolixibacteraceae bacterium]|nr:hypothetical protein [Prolixibacteraceae bacterium]MBN2649233.1 hypothetical protein [Prolixibacteraceae bacterium]